MSFAFVSRHPIEDVMSDSPVQAGINHLAVPRHRAIWSVLAHKGFETGVGETLATIEGAMPRRCGPQEWLVVAGEGRARDIEAALRAIEGASVVDQSDGRVVLVLSGPDVRTLLAKGTAVDLHPSTFAPGHSANALVFHASGNIACIERDRYEITVMRSFALSVFEEIRLMGRACSLTTGFCD